MTSQHYVPGLHVSCCKDGSDPNYLGRGWHETEPEFTWMAGEEADIRFLVRRPREAYTLKLNFVPLDVPDVGQSVEVFFNYFRVGFSLVHREEFLTIELPAALFILREAVIGIHCAGVTSPSLHGGSDTRMLGVAMRSWSLE